MDVLILAGYKKNAAPSAELLDQQIETTRSLGLTPIVVLSGSHADETLRHSKNLGSCELVFDTHDGEANLATNLKAGVHLVSNTCFVLPVDIPAPPAPTWKALKVSFQKLGFTAKTAFIQLVDQQGAPWHWGFPLFVTRLGRHLLLNEENLCSILDARLSYFQCAYEAPEGLAPKTYSL